jgi:hypothetical protein
LWLVFTYSLFTGLPGQKSLFFLASYCLTIVPSFMHKRPFSIFCNGGLAVVNCFTFPILLKVLICPSIRKDSFAGYSSLY